MADQPALESGTKPLDVFISYASLDVARAEALHGRLVAEKFLVWFDKARLNPGCDWHKEIEAGCEAARLILPMLTPHWQKSEWTKYETYAARAVLPIIAQGTRAEVMTPPLRPWQAPELDPLTADDAAWQALFAAIRAKLAEPVPERAPLLVRLAHAPNRFFTGREADMNRLHDALHPGPVPAPTEPRGWAITGLGGLGKTTLANEYVRRFRRLYPQVLWVDAGRGYQAEFAALHDQMFPDRARPDIPDEQKAARVMDALRQPLDRLLVLDNVADEASASDWIPHEGGCRTLLTSRFTGFSAAMRTIALGDLSPDAARAFLLARTDGASRDRDLAACDALAERLGYLPLALEQAGAYMVVQRMGFAKYLRLYEQAAQELLGKQALGSTHYPDSVITTWRVTLERLSPEARAVLRLSAAMGSAPVPLEMLIDGAPQVAVLGATLPELRPRRSWLSWGGRREAGPARAPPAPDRAKAELAVRDAVGEQLHLYSMIQDWHDDSFRVHRLVRDVEWFAMDKGERRYACGLVARLLETHAPTDPRDPAERDACDAALVHGAALWERLREAGLNWPDEKLPGALYECAAARGAVADAEAYALEHYEAAKQHRGPISDVTRRAANRVAHSLYQRGEYAQALPIFQVILHGYEVQDGPEHPNTLTSVSNLAGCLYALGDAAGALPLYRRALDSHERVLGKEHPATLASMNNLAECRLALGDAAGALPLFRRALDSKERVLGKEHPSTLTSVNNLAECMRALGDAAGALPLCRRALDSRERVLGKEHPDTLGSMNNLAGCMRALGDAAGALPLFRRALDSKERVLGKEHPSTLTSVNNLAGCMETLGDAAGALPLYRRALDSSERVLGKEHPDTLTSVGNLAGCRLALGDAAGALPLFRRALDGRERVLGKEHPDTLGSVNNLAGCMRALGDAAGALPLFRRALDSCERVLGREHPDTLSSVNNLAGCMRALGDAAGALPLFRRALDSCERVLGKEHPSTLTSVNNLAGCMETLGDAAGALPLYRRALDSFERVLGKEHPDTLASVNNLANCMRALGDAAGALPLYRRALDSYEHVLGKEHPYTLTSVNNLAGCLDTLGQPVEAEPLHRRALEGLIGRLGPEHPDVLTSQNSLAHSLRKAGHPELAEPYARQCADTSARVLGEAQPLALHRRNNLALTMLMLRRTAEARSLLAANWAAPCPRRTPVTPAIALLAAIAALLQGTDATDPLGRLKTLLLGPKLQQAPDVTHPWDAGYLLDFLRGALPPDSAAFLQAALAAINDPAQALDLDRFPLWRDAHAVPLDVRWPGSAV